MIAELDEWSANNFLQETLGYAVLDSGCSSTVCGTLWLKAYVDSLSCADKDSIKHMSSTKYYKFGDGKKLKAIKSVQLPLHIGETKASIIVDVVEAEIPLLFSKSSLQKGRSKMDFETNTIQILDQSLPMLETSSGHYILSLKRPLDFEAHSVKRIFQSTRFDDNDLIGNKKKILKVHKQFAHPAPDKLKSLLRDAGIKDKKLLNLVDEITEECSTCKHFRRSPARPVVGLPTAHVFNEVVAMDLKVFKQGLYFLHLIDHASRYSQGVVIRNKRKETVVQGLVTHWVQLFGAPGKFLSDNGGEFFNEEFVELAEKFNIKVKVTAAESPWSNGMCERHNGLVALNVSKILDECDCSVETALGWALSAKNSLTNVSGFSPNQLVFGRNPTYPCILDNKAPANSKICHSKIVEDNLRALRLARENHIKAEANEKLSRALNRQTRSYSDQTFCSGDKVYFKRAASNQWSGPATVLGKDGQTYLLKHGGFHIRVHPCRLQLTEVVDNAPMAPTNAMSNETSEVTAEGNPDSNEGAVISSSDERSPDLNTPDPVPDDSEESVPSHHESPSPSVNHSQDTHGPVSNPSNLPKINSDVMLKTTDSDDWRKYKVISRGGKVSGIHWHFMNLQPLDQSTDEICHMSFRDDVREWKPIDQEISAVPDRTSTTNNESQSQHDSLICNVYVGQHTSNSKFHDAKMEELMKWKQMNTYTALPFRNQNLISTSWVCTEKVKGGELICKARLVARGFQEDSSTLSKDSPTCSKDSLRLMLTILASYRWPLQSMDIKSAFLQGMALERNVFLKPPPEASCDDTVWKLNHAVYGLTDASRHWYERVKVELCKLNVEVSKLDPALFFHHHEGKLDGVIAVHVDDFLYSGSPSFLSNVIAQLYQVFVVGSEDFGCMRFLGFDLKQSDSGITMNLNDYIAELKPIDLSSERSSCKTNMLNNDEYASFRRLLGQINWCSSQIRLDIAFDNCFLSNSSAKPLIRDLLLANKVIKKMKASDMELIFTSLDRENRLFLLCFGDASFANLPSGSSQGGTVIFLADSQGRANLVSWQSRKLKRICTSTLCAEALAAIETVNSGYLMLKILQEIGLGQNISIRIITDNKSLAQSVSLLTVVDDKRLRVDIAYLREALKGDCFDGLFWVPSQFNLANPLTKQGASCTHLRDVLSHQLRFDFEKNIFC